MLRDAHGPVAPHDLATRVDAMLAASPHRGAPRAAVELGDCRLAVTDHDGAGDASVAQAGDLVAAVAGRFDNRLEVAESLGLPREASDAAVAATGLRRIGPRFPARLRGRYAVAVSDGRRLWAWRDHIGFGPAFYRVDDGGCYVASEAKQVVAGSGIALRPDIDAVEQILWGDYDDDTPAALAGVRRLAKATLLVADRNGAVSSERYWHPQDLLETARWPVDEVVDRFHVLMAQAAARVVTGREVVSLSGGVDSPAVAAYAAPVFRARTGRRLPALTAVYPDFPAVDERDWVELVAERLDLDLELYEQRARSDHGLDAWMARFDGPVPTVAIGELHESYMQAARRGHRTVLTGELAEFLIDMREGLTQHLVRHGRFSAARRHLAATRARGASGRAMARQLVGALAPARLPRAFVLRLPMSPGSQPPQWVDVDRYNAVVSGNHLSPAIRWHDLQLSAFLGPGLGIEADDIVQESCGIVTRRPWADIDLWEFFLSLPAETKFPTPQQKGLARSLLRGYVPDEILDRRDKTYFDDATLGGIDYAVLRRWLRNPPHRFSGIDYRALGEALDREALGLRDYVWARNLASAHAFVGRW